MFNHLKNQKGLTLLETLIATVVFAVGLLALLGMQITAIQGNSFSNQMSTAVSLASNTIENLSMLDYADPELNPTPTVLHTDVNNPIDELGQPGGIYTREWSVVENADKDMKTITVIVRWNSMIGVQHRVRLRIIRVT